MADSTTQTFNEFLGPFIIDGPLEVTGEITQGGVPVGGGVQSVTAGTNITLDGDALNPVINALQILAGANVTIDTSVPGQITISASGGTADWDTLANKPTVIGAGATARDAQTAMGFPVGFPTVWGQATSGAGASAYTLSNGTANNSVAQRTSAGALAATDGTANNHCATVGQLNGRLSAAQRTAINALTSVSTAADIVAALQAT